MFLDEELDPFDFVLGEKLGMSIGQLEEMPNAEYLQWRAFFVYRADLEEREARKARNGR